MTTYPTQPTGDNSVDLTNIFASNAANKIIMSSEEILEGYNNDGETTTPLTSTPDGNKFNYFWYQVHNTLVWVVNYAKALFDNKLELSGGTMSGALAMGSNKITGLSAGTASTDAVNKSQLDTATSGAKWLGEIWEMAYPYIPTLPAGMEVCECDGRALSKTAYSELYSIMGTTWGGTEAGTTFNIPDKRGVVTRGWDHGRGLDAGRTFGSYQADELKAHAHSIASITGRVYNIGGTGYLTGTDPDIQSGITGGVETRMKNTTGYYVIRIK